MQSITKEIVFELDQIRYPLIPFEIKGREYCHLKMAERMQFDIFFVRDLIQLWNEDRSSEEWKMDNCNISQKTLRGLKGINMDEIELYTISDGEEFDVNFYTNMLLSYLVKLGMITTILMQWMEFLLNQERAHVKNGELHHSLQTYFCEIK